MPKVIPELMFELISPPVGLLPVLLIFHSISRDKIETLSVDLQRKSHGEFVFARLYEGQDFSRSLKSPLISQRKFLDFVIAHPLANLSTSAQRFFSEKTANSIKGVSAGTRR